MKKLTLVLLAVLLLQLTACGKEVPGYVQAQNAMALTCNSTSVTMVGNVFFPSNQDGVFVPDGFTTSAKVNSCNQIMNGTISSSTLTVTVINGIVQPN